MGSPQEAPSTSAAYGIWQQFGLGANNGCGTRSRAISDVENIQRMPPNLSDDEIHSLMAYARGKFAGEPYPFAPALRPIREALAKLDPKPKPEPLALRKNLCAEPSAGEEE